MARIASTGDATILKIQKFLGLNENPDGDTTLKNGEMSVMKNFRITQDNHLQIRAGTKTVLNLADALSALGGESIGETNSARLHGVWRGSISGKEHTVVAYAGHIWDVNLFDKTAVSKGTATEDKTSFFGFGNKVYMLNGHEYMCWDGSEETQFKVVEGYIPVIQTATSPAGEGTLLENVNRLTSKRRVKYSPDGTAKEFVLPEQKIAEVIKVEINGEASTAYTANLEDGKVTFNSAPASGTNTVVITYAAKEIARHEVEKMHFSELFNGGTDARVFLYGDGSNEAIYSGIDDSGQPSAEYFPDLYEIAVGESNTPITSLVRHYSRLMAFKPNSAWVIQYGNITLESGLATAAFYVQPVNRQFGNEAMGQVKLLENSPLTLDVGSVYQWRTTDTYISNAENNAKRVSDRVGYTFRNFTLSDVKTFNIKTDHEYWFIYNKKAVILNYANDSWYVYEDLPFDLLLEVENEKYGFCSDGRIVHFSRTYRNDDGAPIDCYAATGAMDFDKSWLTKYSPMVFVAMQPENNARIYVTAESNRRSDYPQKPVAYSLATFDHLDFNHFSFGTNRKPQVKRIKLKVKKATFYKLIFKSNSASATATVIEANINLRFAGNVK